MRTIFPAWLRPLAWLTLAAVGLVSVRGEDLPFRDWTDSRSNQIRARMVGWENGSVKLRLLFDGKVIEMPVGNLTAADQKYVAGRKHLFAPPGELLPVPGWPGEVVAAEEFSVEEVAGEGGGRVYRTPHFSFRADVKLAPSLINQYARIFEATHQVISILPMRISGPRDEGRFGVRLFRQHADFLSAGGIEGSGGVYLPASREILVPLASLGVRVIGEQVAFNPETFEPSPLVHEITHQLMHRWLDVFPIWFCEGMAEYLSAVPFSSSRFDFERIDEGIREHLLRAGGAVPASGGWLAVDVLAPGELMEISHGRWSRAVSGAGNAGLLYRSGLLLLYYLAHLDGGGDAASLIRYFHETRGWELKRERYVAEYNEAVERHRRELIGWAEAYNKALILHRMETVAYNQKVEVYNQQVRAGFAAAERIDPGPRPGAPPEPPPKPAPPPILADNPDGNVPVDVKAAEEEARLKLFSGRSGAGLWAAFEQALATRKIRVQQVRAPDVPG
jgi:hypothetical protein